MRDLRRRHRQDGPLRRALDDLLHRKHLTGIIHYILTPFARPSEASQGRTAIQSWQITVKSHTIWRKNRVEEAFHEIKSPRLTPPICQSE